MTDIDHLEALKKLVSSGTELNNEWPIVDNKAIFWAVSNDRLDCVDFLIRNGVNINDTNIIDRSPLHVAILYSNLDIAKYLVEHGADLRLVDQDGHTPLMAADYHNRHSIASLIRDYQKSEKDFARLNQSILSGDEEENLKF